MKTIISAILFASALCAQYAPSVSGSTTAAGEINGKLNWQTSTAACVGLNGTVGKDTCTDTATGFVYVPSVTGTPATWVRIPSAAPAALAGTPVLCSTGQPSIGILANGNTAGCVAVATKFVAPSEQYSSSTLGDLATPDSLSVTCSGTCTLAVQYSANGGTITTGAVASCTNSIYIDGSQVDVIQGTVYLSAGFAYGGQVGAQWKAVGLATGAHTIDVKHSTNSTTCQWQDRLLTVIQVP